MLGAVQLGLLAACVVLFVPMAMAGWHLSRNKMLFFSGALFITLAIGVHLTPYFPSVSDLVSSVSTVMVVEAGDPCVSLLHEIAWDVKPVEEDRDRGRDRNLSRYEENWNWTRSNRVRECGFQRLGKADSSDLLNGSWVVVAGDSQARLIALSLLSLVLDPEKMGLVRDDLFKRHSDYRIEIEEIGMKLDFIWAPYTTNLTDMALKLKQDRNYPDVLVMGSGLWHMLHITNAIDYGISLQLLKSAVMQLLPFYPEMASTSTSSSISHEELGSVRSPHMFWLGMPMLVNGMLNTVEKREKMTDELWHSYDQELRKSKLLHQSGGPLFLLDVQSLSWNCGPRCTIDGMHYSEPVYEAATHIMLNALLIESHQRLEKG